LEIARHEKFDYLLNSRNAYIQSPIIDEEIAEQYEEIAEQKLKNPFYLCCS